MAQILAPLVEGDGGELYAIQRPDGTLHLHLSGRFSGCPGNSLVTEQVVKPLLEATRPGTKLMLTSGPLIPPSAERIRPA